MEQGKKIQMVVFDWAGTTVDYGSLAPLYTFEKVFRNAGLTLTRDEINKPMGMEKKAHIRALLSEPGIKEQWIRLYGREWSEEDVENLYADFEGELYQVVKEYSQPLDGVVDTVGQLRDMGIRIGSTTGYNAWMMEQVSPQAAQKGYQPDCLVTPDDTGTGRPTPFMMFECMLRMNVYPPRTVVKVGDTVADILEGKNAGAWSIGVLTGSNLLGLTKEEYDAMDFEQRQEKKRKAEEKYLQAGADLVIDHIGLLPEAVLKINELLSKEELGQ